MTLRCTGADGSLGGRTVLVSTDSARPGDALDRVDQEPANVVDRLLWRDAQQMLDRHAEPDESGGCVWCGRAWPCAARRLAERAEFAAFRPWNEAWTTRHDLHSLRAVPGWRADLDGRAPHQSGRNLGAFEPGYRQSARTTRHDT